MGAKRVLVSGCFDLLHSGHIYFLNRAAEYGELYVALGSDKTIKQLKGRAPICPQAERMYMVRALKCVSHAFVSGGSGQLDFAEDMARLQVDIFIVNEDGASEEKRKFCAKIGVEYLVLKRDDPIGRSTTELKRECVMPFRIDLAGGWLDQPFVSKHWPGDVLTISIEPNDEFMTRCGMATSTRIAAVALWGGRIPTGDYEQLAKKLFAYDSFPGRSSFAAGSQDAIGIVFPGLAVSRYDGKYWPESIEHIQDESILSWIENHICLIPIGPRKEGFDPLAGSDITAEKAERLAVCATKCLEAIHEQYTSAFGLTMTEAFQAQLEMFPAMMNEEIRSVIEKHGGNAYGCKLTGAGGGGYMVFVCDRPLEGSTTIKIRRGDS